ncbi:MAG: hypothetical protein LBE51_08690 [Acidovorax sp.]|jgi:hypothetical protein|nr:hypothetical protein [Acidovorax sp.]
MQEATAQQIALLHHTLGLRPDQREGRRNHFVAGPGHHDMQDLEALERLGLMARGRAPALCEPGDIVFRTTDAGRALAIERLPDPPPPKKHNQHHQWLDADSGHSFGEWLCGGQLPKFETRGYCGYGSHNTLEYRMYRMSGYGYGAWCDVEGQWAKTKKEAKASYKAALKARKAQRAAAQKGE